ncbi:unnamed protein product, partial [Polarella glacialis]
MSRVSLDLLPLTSRPCLVPRSRRPVHAMLAARPGFRRSILSQGSMPNRSVVLLAATAVLGARAFSRRVGQSAQGHDEVSLVGMLRFWFGAEMFDSPERLDEVDYLRSRSKVWYRGGEEVDAVARRYLPLLRSERERLESDKGRLQAGSQKDERGLHLARVVLFDQVSRNAARGTAEAFRQDALACELVQACTDAGFDKSCRAAELIFLAQPLVHAEVPGDGSLADVGIQLLKDNMRRFPPATSQHLLKEVLTHDKHLAVLRRFGRYPHRNSVLARESTEE